MTTMTKQTNVSGETFRLCKQNNDVTCGPAACLIMWANVHGMDPAADEGGVIALSRMFPEPWTQAKGANIANLVKVLAQMGIQTTLQRHDHQFKLRDALYTKVRSKRPALAFLKWVGASSVVGHFVVIGSTSQTDYRFTVLDPKFGLQETYGLPTYAPTDDDTLEFTGAVAVMS